MAKVIKYQYHASDINTGMESDPKIEKIILLAEIVCKDEKQYAENLPIAEKEAIPGTIEVSGEFDDEPTEPTQEERIAELEEALEMLLNGVTE